MVPASRARLAIDPIAWMSERLRQLEQAERFAKHFSADQVQPFTENAASVNARLVHEINSKAATQQRWGGWMQQFKRLLQHVFAMYAC